MKKALNYSGLLQMKIKTFIKRTIKAVLPLRTILFIQKSIDNITLEKKRRLNHYKNKDILKFDMNYDKSTVCKYPFSFVEICADGSVKPCCGYWNIIGQFGKYLYTNFEEIWNSDNAKKMRKSCWAGDYDYCNLDLCFPAFVSKENFKSNYDHKRGTCNTYPNKVKFAYDKSCNVNCIMCRDEVITNNYKQTERLDSFVKPLFLPMLKDAKLVELSGYGELFASKHSIKLIKEIIKVYPEIKFAIHSNGILCNEKNCIDIFGSIEKIDNVNLSIHAATKETYEKIVKNGNFAACMENIKWLSLQKKLGTIKSLALGFCVHALNYREMKMFLEKAILLDIGVSFWLYQPWGTNMDENYKNYSVWDINHPEYNDIVELLKDPIFNDSHCSMNKMLNDLRK